VSQGLLADAAVLDAWIAEGEADADAGRVVPLDEVIAELDDIIARAEER
jgi:predicted transcriptional regulator